MALAPIQALLFLALSLSLSGAMLSDSLVAFSAQNPDNSLAFLAIPIFLYLLLPSTFTTSLILLLLHAAAPHSTYIKHLTSVTRVLVSATLLLGAPLMVMVHAAFVQAPTPTPGTLMAVYVGAAVLLVHKYVLFNIYLNFTTKTVSSSVPASVALCFSAGIGIFLLVDPFASFEEGNGESASAAATIQLFLLALNFFNFVLAVGLLFVRMSMSVPADGPGIAIPVAVV